MKRRNMFVAAALIGVLALGAMAAAGKLGGRKKDGLKAVAVARGSLVDKALAVGTIEPRVEVSVKSILAGVVRQRFAAVGDFVKRGQPLLEISPNPTPLEMVELRRNVELREIELKNLERELGRQQELRDKNLISPSDLETAQRQVDEARSQLSLAQERLALEEGATLRAGYSANAEVIIARRDSVLYVPERLITHRNDSSFVTVRTGPGKTAERSIKTGLSDAINIEVLEGLQPTDSIIEPPPREIS